MCHAPLCRPLMGTWPWLTFLAPRNFSPSAHRASLPPRLEEGPEQHRVLRCLLRSGAGACGGELGSCAPVLPRPRPRLLRGRGWGLEGETVTVQRLNLSNALRTRVLGPSVRGTVRKLATSPADWRLISCLITQRARDGPYSAVRPEFPPVDLRSRLDRPYFGQVLQAQWLSSLIGDKKGNVY